jgi:hypothetical protein
LQAPLEAVPGSAERVEDVGEILEAIGDQDGRDRGGVGGRGKVCILLGKAEEQASRASGC